MSEFLGQTALTISDIGQQLAHTTFVIVDLETAGGKPGDAGITEIGAVKVRGGEVLGEFRTFCHPGVPIPAFISVLTGITNHHVATAPNVASAVIEFLAFAGFDCEDPPVLVAHNAPFDVGFLKSACAKFDIHWPAPKIVDTVILARKILRKDEVKDKKLATLARFFSAPVSPTHRALDDARATVSVLHGLIERVGNLGVHDLAGLTSFDGPGTQRRRRKRHLATDLPESPGVYIFYDGADRALYIGTSKNIRKRVMTYFTAAESRSRMTAMVELAQRVQGFVCETRLEATIRELRIINELRPSYNARSRNPEKTIWLTLTDEKFPRASLIRQATLPTEDRTFIGPFVNQSWAQLAMDALHETTKLRQCKDRITSKSVMSACALYEMDRCIAPCLPETQAARYDAIVVNSKKILGGDSSHVTTKFMGSIQKFVDLEKFEEAALSRDRMHALAGGVHRATKLRSLSLIPFLLAAQLNELGGWDIHAITYGRLAGAIQAPPGQNPKSYLVQLKATIASEVRLPTLVSETELLLKWLGDGSTRLIEIAAGHTWQHPITAPSKVQELRSG